MGFTVPITTASLSLGPGTGAGALACGAAVVSTDCPSGPREILEGGRFGKLVPVGNVEALAIAMGETLDCAPDREAGQKRAMDFSMEKGVREYFNLVMELVGTN